MFYFKKNSQVIHTSYRIWIRCVWKKKSVHVDNGFRRLIISHVFLNWLNSWKQKLLYSLDDHHLLIRCSHVRKFSWWHWLFHLTERSTPTECLCVLNVSLSHTLLFLWAHSVQWHFIKDKLLRFILFWCVFMNTKWRPKKKFLQKTKVPHCYHWNQIKYRDIDSFVILFHFFWWES